MLRESLWIFVDICGYLWIFVDIASSLIYMLVGLLTIKAFITYTYVKPSDTHKTKFNKGKGKGYSIFICTVVVEAVL
jgi:hypothetical protein